MHIRVDILSSDVNLIKLFYEYSVDWPVPKALSYGEDIVVHFSFSQKYKGILGHIKINCRWFQQDQNCIL